VLRTVEIVFYGAAVAGVPVALAARTTGIHHGGVIPFLECDMEIRRVICSTNAIELLNARHRRSMPAVTSPTRLAALKCLCPVTRSLDVTGTGRARWTGRKSALNAFAVTFADRFPAAEDY
jgi:putative transposase